MEKYAVIYMNQLKDKVIFGWYDELDTAKFIVEALKLNHKESIKEVWVYECKR